MVLLQTIGSVDMPGRGERKLPSPRSYLAIVIAWGGLQIAADAGAERPATVFGWLLVLVGMVAGPFGSQLTSLFTSVVNQVTGATS